MRKNILIIQGHPDPESFNYALAKKYQEGATKAGAEVHLIHVGELDFEPNLKYGYRKRVDLEPCLLDAQEKIKQAHHIVLIHPVWWGATPAILKGFIDRVFLPGFAFKKREGSLWWDKLLSGKSARIISTLDQPAWYYLFIYWRPSIQSLKRLTFHFCGIKPVRTTTIGPVRNSTEKYRQKVLDKVYKIGLKLK